ncbi:MAG TPA: SurA N-terminal domain-containing protein [Kofleriaceae bacterium]|nr:SurA N-terminal domain-containing protein [Kofleriaceae bacterium]
MNRVPLLLASTTALAVLAAAPAAAPAQGGWTPVDSVIAVVNQEVVLKSDLDRRLAAYKASLDAVKDPGERAKKRIELRKQMIAGLIDEHLLNQEAMRMGLGASDAEVDRAIADIKAKNKLDDAGLNKALAEQGLTLVIYREELRSQIMQAKVTNVVLRPRVQITDDELHAAYDEAKKRDPKRIGTYDEVKRPLAERVFEDKITREQMRWLVERRNEAYIDMRDK